MPPGQSCRLVKTASSPRDLRTCPEEWHTAHAAGYCSLLGPACDHHTTHPHLQRGLAARTRDTHEAASVPHPERAPITGNSVHRAAPDAHLAPGAAGKAGDDHVDRLAKPDAPQLRDVPHIAEPHLRARQVLRRKRHWREEQGITGYSGV